MFMIFFNCSKATDVLRYKCVFSDVCVRGFKHHGKKLSNVVFFLVRVSFIDNNTKTWFVDLPWGLKQNDWNEKGKKRCWTTMKRLARNVSSLYEEISIHLCIFFYFWLCNQLRTRWMFFLPRWIFSVFFLLPYTFSHSSSAMWCCFYFLSTIGVTSPFFRSVLIILPPPSY